MICICKKKSLGDLDSIQCIYILFWDQGEKEPTIYQHNKVVDEHVEPIELWDRKQVVVEKKR